MSGHYAYHLFAVVCVREANANGLLEEEDIGMVIPRILEALSRVGASDSAGTCNTYLLIICK